MHACFNTPYTVFQNGLDGDIVEVLFNQTANETYIRINNKHNETVNMSSTVEIDAKGAQIYSEETNGLVISLECGAAIKVN